MTNRKEVRMPIPPKRRSVVAIFIGVFLLAGTLTACGGDESREDADDVGNGQINKAAPSVTSFNNRYPNIETKCIHETDENSPGVGLRAIVTTDGRMLVIADPHCPGFVDQQAGTAAVGGNGP